MTPQRKLAIRKTLAHAFLLGFVALVLVPFVIVIAASFRKGNFAPSKVILAPSELSLEHWKFVVGIPYREVVNATTGETRIVQAPTPPLLWFWNSIKVSAGATIGIILLSGTAAYAFARMQFMFKHETLGALLILQMFPPVLAIVAYYVMLDVIRQFS